MQLCVRSCQPLPFQHFHLCKALRSAAPGSLTAISPSSINCFTLPRSPLFAALCSSVSVGMAAFHGEWPRCGPTRTYFGSTMEPGQRPAKAPRREPTTRPGSGGVCDAEGRLLAAFKCGRGSSPKNLPNTLSPLSSPKVTEASAAFRLSSPTLPTPR